MKLKRLKIQNFRTIENLSFDFPCFYTAVSGRNNSGKSNLLRALSALFEPEQRYRWRSEELSYSENFPIWKRKDSVEPITLVCDLQIDRVRDSSVFKLAKDFFALDDAIADIVMTVSAEYHKDKDQPELVISYGSQPLESYKSRTMLKTIKSAGAFQFHNSTAMDDPFTARSAFADLIGEIATEDRAKLIRDRDKLSKTIASVAKRHQREISELLGRLEDKYVVGLSAPKLNVDLMPINITLGEKSPGVSLEEWGSGTQNRTHILMALFRARKLSETPDEDRKIAPVLVIEEPESFLHPSAQAEFGRLVQDMSETMQIQVIVATHSPYFLSQQKPESNILLSRSIKAGKLEATENVEVGSENWMEPFALNLGLANPEFEPWKELFFGQTDRILLVEGAADKEYFEMLRSPEHGDNRLNFEGEISSYDGKGNIQNGVLLKFIRSKYSKCFLTFDLDAEAGISKQLISLGMEKNKDFCSVGMPGDGTDNIEGLLPEVVKKAVFSANFDLVQTAMSTNKEAARQAKERLKALQLQEFKRVAVPGQEHYGHFYKLVKIINKAFS